MPPITHSLPTAPAEALEIPTVTQNRLGAREIATRPSRSRPPPGAEATDRTRPERVESIMEIRTNLNRSVMSPDRLGSVVVRTHNVMWHFSNLSLAVGRAN